MKVSVFENKSDIAVYVAKEIAALIRNNDLNGKNTVLCLPTGSTPIPVYKELISIYKEGNLSFKNVYTFNLDEYYPISHESVHSYHFYMKNNFFGHIDIPEDHVHIPSGELELNAYFEHCAEYERKINQLGGLDLALLGIGRTGHIGFNEPGSKITDRTRLVVLDSKTRDDAKDSFGGLDKVPMKAVTMGIGSILDARRVIIIATGENKAEIVQKTLEQDGIAPEDCPAKFLLDHNDCQFLVDRVAGELLQDNQVPWLTRDLVHFTWNFELAKKALIWLSFETGKSIFQLTDEDFNSHHLSTLVYHWNYDIDRLCREVFDDILYRIDTHTNSLLPIQPNEKILIMSPHPDDDVISCGGTLETLISRRQGKNITIAYQTAGSNAVSTDELKHHLRFFNMSSSLLLANESESTNLIEKVVDGINNNTKENAQIIQKLQTNVRRAEAITAIESLGLTENDAVFLDMPFYYRKSKSLEQDDIQLLFDLFDRVNPDHIFIAGDLSDPHGTHGKCYSAIKEALTKWRESTGKKSNKCWLYRGAWQEYPIHEATVFVPFSKRTLDRKIYSIYKHGSQNLSPMFPGEDKREFWERARDRNLGTAKKLRDLGFPSFYAVEAFYTCYELPSI